MPYVDYALYRPRDGQRCAHVLLNLGGISNLTLLVPGGGPDHVLALDAGPANCISDAIMRGEGQACDAGGVLALRGAFHPPVFNAFMRDAYFSSPLPRSTDPTHMLRVWADAVATIDGRLHRDDALATAAWCVAAAVVTALASAWAGVAPQFRDACDDMRVIVSGGGVHNAAIMACITRACGLGAAGASGRPTPDAVLAATSPACSSMPHIACVQSLDDWVAADATVARVSGDQKEAVGFGILAAAAIDRIPANIPSVTGASRRAVCGSVTFP